MAHFFLKKQEIRDLPLSSSKTSQLRVQRGHGYRGKNLLQY